MQNVGVDSLSRHDDNSVQLHTTLLKQIFQLRNVLTLLSRETTDFHQNFDPQMNNGNAKIVSDHWSNWKVWFLKNILVE
jgi:hypothetical protein